LTHPNHNSRDARRLGLFHDGSSARHTLPRRHIRLAPRAWEHRSGGIEGFTKRYGLTRLVHAEFHDDIRSAIARERTLKHWRRAWTVQLIEKTNPDWADVYDRLG